MEILFPFFLPFFFLFCFLILCCFAFAFVCKVGFVVAFSLLPNVSEFRHRSPSQIHLHAQLKQLRLFLCELLFTFVLFLVLYAYASEHLGDVFGTLGRCGIGSDTLLFARLHVTTIIGWQLFVNNLRMLLLLLMQLRWLRRMRHGHYVISLERNQSAHATATATTVHMRLLYSDAGILISYIVRTAAAAKYI